MCAVRPVTTPPLVSRSVGDGMAVPTRDHTGPHPTDHIVPRGPGPPGEWSHAESAPTVSLTGQRRPNGVLPGTTRPATHVGPPSRTGGTTTDMRARSLGVTALAVSSVMVAIYGQYAAIALLMTGSIYAAAGSPPAALALILGAVFLGVTVAAYFVGYGLWSRKHWAWAGGVTIFVVFAIANVLLSVLSANLISSILPALVAIVAVWYFYRPAVKEELLGTGEKTDASIGVSDSLKGAEPAR